MSDDVRRVVTGHDDAGRSVFTSDGAAPRSLGVFSEIWHLPGPPLSIDAGGDGPSEWELEPVPGGISWRVLSLPPDPPPGDGRVASAASNDPRFDADRPGMHQTDTIDFIQILQGEVHLELDDEATVHLLPGDCVVQRGTWHAWRNRTSEPCVFSAVMLRTDPGARDRGMGDDARPRPTDIERGTCRRVVTELTPEGRSVFATDGEPPNAIVLEHGGGMAYTDLWQSLGPVASPASGGDPDPARIELDPLEGGVAWKRVVIPPASTLAGLDGAALSAEMKERAPGMSAGGHHDPDQPGRHRTDTIDFVQILEGEIDLALDEGEARLSPGDCVVQRGTWHTWTNRGDTPCVFNAVLVTAKE